MGIVVVFIVIFAIIAIVVSASQSQRTREGWSRAANRLGMRFEPGGVFSRPTISGSIGGIPVTVTTVSKKSGNSSTTYTDFRVFYPHPLGLGLQLTEEGFFSGIARFFGGQDIEVGDAEFDTAFTVKGRDPRAVTAFLTPARRVRIHRLFRSHPGAVIDDQKIHWQRRGTIRDPDRIASTVKYLVRIAWSLAEVREEDSTFERALEAQRGGRVEQALAILKERTGSPRRQESAAAPVAPTETPPAEDTALPPEPVEERLLEGELLHLTGRAGEAKQAFEEARGEIPDDPEVRQWAELTAGDAPAESAQSVEAPEPDVESVCAALFDPKHSSFEINRIFADRFQGRPIRWSGRLQSVESFSYDVVLGNTPGTKAIFEVYEAPAALYGERTVLAVVRFPEEAHASLGGLTGQECTFTGKLLKVDGYMRNLYVADGELLT